MRITSRGGKRYVLVIVDDYSRFIWTLFLVSKDEYFWHQKVGGARIKAIHILLAFTAYMKIKLYQMDVKSAFLNGYIKEMYVS